MNVAALLDLRGSPVVDAHESYWRHATGGLFPPADLECGERLLVDCGLVVERDGVLHRSPQLLELLGGTVDDAIAAMTLRVLALAVTGRGETLPGRDDTSLADLLPDPTRREELLIALRSRWEDAHRQEIGAIGEEVVVATARGELETLGHPDLARRVRRVSLDSDQLGYDVSAPRVAGPPRLLEVKATTIEEPDAFTVHLSRNEAEVGLRYPDHWTLVTCRVSNIANRQGVIVGWCTASALESSLPADTADAKWESAEVRIRLDLLEPDLPRASF